MKLQTIEEIRHELSDTLSGKMDSLSFIVEKTTGQGAEHFLLLKGSEYRLFARPYGFQLSPEEGKPGDKSYSITYDEIVSLQLLPSVSVKKSQGINWLHVMFYGVIFYLAGRFMAYGSELTAWLPCGLVFGAIYSATRKSYRKNFLLTLDDFQILLSLASGDVFMAKEMFPFYLGGKFEID